MDVAATACSRLDVACSSFRLAANSSLTRPLQETAVSSRAPCLSLLGGQRAADHASATSTCRRHVGKRQLRFRPVIQLGLQCQAAGRAFSAHGRIAERPGPLGSTRVTELGFRGFHMPDAHQVHRAATSDGPLGGVTNQVSASCPEEEGVREACNGSKVSGPLLMETLEGEKAPTNQVYLTVDQKPSATPSPGSISQRALLIALSLVLAIGPGCTPFSAHAMSSDASASIGVAGVQTDSVSKLLDASKDSLDGQGSIEKVAAKAGELRERASAMIEGAKEKSNKVRKGTATLVEAAKDGPGGEKEAEQVAQKADQLKEKTSEGVRAMLSRSAKMQEGAKQLAEAAELDVPGATVEGASKSASSSKQSGEKKAGQESKESVSSEGRDAPSGGSGGLLGAFQAKVEQAREGLAKVPDKIRKGSKEAIKDDAPEGVESGIKGAVKEGVAGSVKEGLTGAVTGGVGGGVTGAAVGAAKGAVSGATS